MSQYVLLNHKDHSELRINTTRSRELGDDIMYAMTFPHEFRDIQSCYPICFRKDPDTGVFHPVALFGLSLIRICFLRTIIGMRRTYHLWFVDIPSNRNEIN
ncbi:MAG: hypothetical protein CM15mP51_09520 [Porticoccaceae bacterium]|nr:MAG: hypothetical protein CM15mP51_09520 [Porticoccaceae bacterium]